EQPVNARRARSRTRRAPSTGCDRRLLLLRRRAELLEAVVHAIARVLPRGGLGRTLRHARAEAAEDFVHVAVRVAQVLEVRAVLRILEPGHALLAVERLGRAL